MLPAQDPEKDTGHIGKGTFSDGNDSKFSVTEIGCRGQIFKASGIGAVKYQEKEAIKAFLNISLEVHGERRNLRQLSDGM